MSFVLLSILTFIATYVGTITGFGSSTIMLPIVVLFFPLPIALLFVGILHTFNDIWKVILFREHVHWKLILLFGIPGIALSVIGANIALSVDQNLLSKILGIILILYVLLITLRPNFHLPKNNLSAILGGSLSGITAGIFGVGGAARGMFLSAFNLKKQTYLFTSGMIALFIDLPRLTAYFYGGVRLYDDLLWGMVIFIPLSFAAAELGKYAVDKIPQKHFRLFIGAFLLLVGIRLFIS